MHVIEFCQFVEEKIKMSNSLKKDDLVQLRVLRGPQPHYYTILIKLSSTEASTKFLQEFQNRKFNQIELDKCSVYTTQDLSSALFTEAPSEDNQTNCPICLESIFTLQFTPHEQMRQDDFLVTVLCGHTFHWMCLRGWSDTTCPLCRYH